METKNLFKTILVMTLFCFTSPVMAQDRMPPRSPQEKAHNQTRRMQSLLQLTPEQNARVYNINLAYAQKAEELANMPAGGEKKMDRQAMAANKDNELKAVLTGEQYQKYQQMVAEMKEKMKERRAMQQE